MYCSTNYKFNVWCVYSSHFGEKQQFGIFEIATQPDEVLQLFRSCSICVHNVVYSFYCVCIINQLCELYMKSSNYHLILCVIVITL